MGRRAQSRLRSVRLFRSWRIWRRVHRRHHRALAGRERHGVRAVLCRAAGCDRLIDGRLDGAIAGAGSRASLAGLVLIAPAPDFTEQLMWNGFSPEVRQEIETKGVWLRPSQYGEPYPIPRAFIEEGRNHLLLGSAIDVGCPVRILQGAQDPDVPWQHAFALAHRLPSDDF